MTADKKFGLRKQWPGFQNHQPHSVHLLLSLQRRCITETVRRKCSTACCDVVHRKVKKGEDHICLANGTKGFSISLAFRDKGALPAISRQPAVSLFVSIYLHALASGLSWFFF